MRRCNGIQVTTLTLLFALPIGAKADPPDVCKKIAGLPSLQKLDLDVIPNYFIKVFGPFDSVAFGSNKGNTMFDLKTSTAIPTPGFVDPVPTPDGRSLMTPTVLVYDPEKKVYSDLFKSIAAGGAIPEYTLDGDAVTKAGKFINGMTAETIKAQKIPYGVSGLGFYATEDVRTKGKDAPSQFFDPDVSANYPSTGVLEKNEKSSLIRTLANGTGMLRIKDYRIVKSADGRDHISPVGPSRTICEDTKFPGHELSYLSQPSLSKKGTEVGAYDALKKKMRIMKIGNNGQCTEVESLPFAAGKIDFSPDDRQILFHVDHTEQGPNQFQNPSASQTLHSYLYDRDTKRTTPINVDPNLDTYYPSFLGDGRILYFAKLKNSPDSKLQIHIVDPRNSTDTAAEVPCTYGTCAQKNPRAFLSMLAIAKLYEKICEDAPSSAVTPDGAFMTTLTLEPVACKKLVKEYWVKHRAAIVNEKSYAESPLFDQKAYRGLELADLLAACPKARAGSSQ